MTLNKGPESTSAPNFKKYSQEQLEKFKEITNAQEANNFELANELMINLSPEDDEKFDEYLDDCKRLFACKRSAEELLTHHLKEIESSEKPITITNSKSSEILHLHKHEVAVAVEAASTPRNSIQAKQDIMKKKRVCCALM
jgi:hypothetical protein